MRYNLGDIARIVKLFLMIGIGIMLVRVALYATILYSSLIDDSLDINVIDPIFQQSALIETVFRLLFYLVAFLFWIYRASFNMQLKFGQQSISPGWAVGWNFIPFANFIMVYRVMANLWQCFSPTPAQRGFLLTWWILRMSIPIVDRFWEKMSVFDENLAVLIVIDCFIFAGFIIASAMEIRVITVITKGEEKTAEAAERVFS